MSKRLLCCILLFLVAAATQTLHVAHAQTGNEAAARRHAEGLVMERRGDEKGAFSAFLVAAEGGYPPAQRRLGEIYDGGNSAIGRNYSESIRWYEKAREGGEQIPAQKSPMPVPTTRP
jgi:TPR repeat protein